MNIRERTPLLRFDFEKVTKFKNKPYNFCLGVIILLLIWSIYMTTTWFNSNNGYEVYNIQRNEFKQIYQILKSEPPEDKSLILSVNEAQLRKLTKFSEIKPSPKNIFFIESRCGMNQDTHEKTSLGGLTLQPRQICAIESTAIRNKNRPIYILYTCHLGNDYFTKSSGIVQLLLSYKNVHLVRLNMTDLVSGSIVEKLYFGGGLKKSSYPVEHVSDLMRLVTLWRFGGTYLDLDIISLRALDGLGSNFAGFENPTLICNAVINFSGTEFGRTLLKSYLEEFTAHYDPYGWAENGPQMLTKTITKMCNISGHRPVTCNDFTVYDMLVFYPVYADKWDMLFKEKYTEEVLKLVTNAYIVHIWNKLSGKQVVRVGSKQAYALLAEKFCPLTYSYSGEYM